MAVEVTYSNTPFADLVGLLLGIWPVQCRPESPWCAIIVSNSSLQR